MTVEQLIERLREMPPHYDVEIKFLSRSAHGESVLLTTSVLLVEQAADCTVWIGEE